jgi:diguanylate cyclase (GGDEF)-like protein
MKTLRAPRDLFASLLPTAGALLALAVVTQWLREPMPPLALAAGLALAGAAAAAHRPLDGAVTLGLGAAALPLAFSLFGPVAAGWGAAACLLLAQIVIRIVRQLAALPLADRRGLLPRAFEAAGRATLAALAGAGLGAWLAPRSGWLSAFGGAALLYLILWALLEIADRKIRRPAAPLRLKDFGPLALDACGWAAGSLVALIGLRAGPALALGALTLVALLSVEAARNRLLRDRARFRVTDLERLQRAAQRVTTAEQEMVALAERIRIECTHVVDFRWYQFEALAPGSEFKSWWWGPESEELEDGVPEPERFPPPLPGFHRRAVWQILERPMRSRPDMQVMARVRLWCDPRVMPPRAVEMLDELLPQMTASVQRCLLDRQANEDPLTGLAVRRVLERRLHAMHARCCEVGGSMAVILVDLDHFKKINDTYGHPAGDRALVAVASVFKQLGRGADVLCRYGGEEFVLLLEEASGHEALAAAERYRQAVEAIPFEVEGQPVPLTLSAGVASFPELYIKTGAELILFADEALYEAKRHGRNRCLLDIGQGRYLDLDGNLVAGPEAAPVPAPPRIFA